MSLFSLPHGRGSVRGALRSWELSRDREGAIGRNFTRETNRKQVREPEIGFDKLSRAQNSFDCPAGRERLNSATKNDL